MQGSMYTWAKMENLDVKREFCDVDLVPSLHGGLLAEENDDRCDDEGGTQNCQEGKKPQWYLLSLKMDRAIAVQLRPEKVLVLRVRRPRHLGLGWSIVWQTSFWSTYRVSLQVVHWRKPRMWFEY